MTETNHDQEPTPQPKLDDLTALTMPISLPSELLPGFMSGRPGLIRAWPKRALSDGEAVAVVDALATLIETNEALRAHSREVHAKIRAIRSSVKGLLGSVLSCEALSDFRNPGGDEDVD